MKNIRLVICSILVLLITSLNAQTEQNINIKTGWNLISSPINSNDLSKNTILPSAVSQLFAFNNGYNASDSLKMGKGFWIKYPNNATSTVNGQVFNSNSIPVFSGWNLIGIYNYSVNTNQITFANGTISSQFFDFNNGYSAATTLEPGKGYWVKVTANGNLTIPVALPAVPNHLSPTNNATNTNTTLTFAWNTANAATSYNLQIADNIQFTNALLHTNITNTSFQVNNLLQNKTYYWRVSSTINAGTSNYSNHWSFTTKVANSKLVTPEILGQPLLSYYGNTKMEAQNVWDLHEYNGKIYIGSGDWQWNYGPVPLYRFDPITNNFSYNYLAPAESIEQFYTLSTGLWTTDIDPKGGGGNVYHLENETSNLWSQKNYNDEIHTWCMAEFNDTLFNAGYNIYRSANNGHTWDLIYSRPPNYYSTRFYGFLQFPNKLFLTYRGWKGLGLFIYEKGKFVNNTIFAFNGFPNTTLPNEPCRIYRPIRLLGINENKTAYIGAFEIIGDIIYDPFAIYISEFKNNKIEVERIMPINDNYKPYDLKIDSSTSTLYVLLYEKNTTPFKTLVWKTTDLVNWSEVLHFTYQNVYARSFEIINGDFYFGMGSDRGKTSGHTGTILRVKKEQYDN